MSDWKNVQYKDGKMRTSEGGGGGGSSTFAGLDDVSFSNVQNGQVPKYNSTTQKWENADESGGGTVTDVQVDGVSVVNPQGVAEINTPDADGIEYDNQQSGLSATDVQSAIDELAQGSGGGVEDVEVNGTSVVNAQNVAEIKSYKEVTQAEYQALPSSKLTDNILYCIKDSAGADGFPPLIYSDEEREVGVWRDGKPLYQKTIRQSFTTASQVTIGTNIDYVQTIATTYLASGIYDSPFYMPSNTRVYCFVQCESDNSITLNNEYNGNIEWIVTIQYTKTTDTAGSGTWTTQGGYAHHYSTTEHVVGTWVDGKPLYEKSYIDSGSWQSGTEVVIDTGYPSGILDNIMILCGYTNGSYYIPLNNIILNTNYISYAYVQNENGGNATIKFQSGFSFTKYAITIRYTKTTD